MCDSGQSKILKCYTLFGNTVLLRIQQPTSGLNKKDYLLVPFAVFRHANSIEEILIVR